jgi:hypothetical protein
MQSQPQARRRSRRVLPTLPPTPGPVNARKAGPDAPKRLLFRADRPTSVRFGRFDPGSLGAGKRPSRPGKACETPPARGYTGKPFPRAVGRLIALIVTLFGRGAPVGDSPFPRAVGRLIALIVTLFGCGALAAPRHAVNAAVGPQQASVPANVLRPTVGSSRHAPRRAKDTGGKRFQQKVAVSRVHPALSPDWSQIRTAVFRSRGIRKFRTLTQPPSRVGDFPCRTVEASCREAPAAELSAAALRHRAEASSAGGRVSSPVPTVRVPRRAEPEDVFESGFRRWAE